MAIRYEHSLDRTFHALGDGTRRAMLTRLARSGECTAGELGEPFPISQPTASQHVRVLERAGLLSRRVDGRTHRLRLVPRPLQEAERWISRHRAFWEGTLDRLGGFLRDLDRKGGADA
jgi:DNA-binding transcriptional ArsR family regulator